MKKDLEMFFHADIVGIIFGLTANLLCIYDAQMLGYHSSCTYLDVLGKLSLSNDHKIRFSLMLIIGISVGVYRDGDNRCSCDYSCKIILY